MKRTILISITLLLAIVTILSSCSKSSTTKQPSDLGGLNGTWFTPNWGGTSEDTLKFTISSTMDIGTVSAVGTPSYNFSVGDQFYTNIASSGTNTYNSIGRYTYGVNNQSASTRAAVMTLSNTNTILTVDYPAITSGLNAGFPDLIYVFQKQ